MLGDGGRLFLRTKISGGRFQKDRADFFLSDIKHALSVLPNVEPKFNGVDRQKCDTNARLYKFPGLFPFVLDRS